jgi:hypothetical protein
MEMLGCDLLKTSVTPITMIVAEASINRRWAREPEVQHKTIQRSLLPTLYEIECFGGIWEGIGNLAP